MGMIGIPMITQERLKNKMYICNHCGNLFDEFENGRSPCCYAGYERAEKCSLCGDYYKTTQMQDGLCPICRVNTLEQFKYFLNNEFTEKQREYLNDYYDGRRL